MTLFKFPFDFFDILLEITVTTLNRDTTAFFTRHKDGKRRTKRNINAIKTFLKMLETQEKTPGEILSKSQVVGLVRMASAFINIYDVLSRSFGLLQVLFQVILTLAKFVL